MNRPLVIIAKELEAESIEPYQCHHTSELYLITDTNSYDSSWRSCRLLDQFLQGEGKKYKTERGKQLINQLKVYRKELYTRINNWYI